MRQPIIVVTLLLALAACGNAAPHDTVESLVAHPARLREVEQQCANDYAAMGAAECNAASEARRKLFMGHGPQYTPPKTSSKF